MEFLPVKMAFRFVCEHHWHGKKISKKKHFQVEEGREAEASTQMVTDKRTTRQTRHKEESQRPTPIVWDGGKRHSDNCFGKTKSIKENLSNFIEQSSPQQRGINRGTLNRGQTGRGGRARGKRPFV